MDHTLKNPIGKFSFIFHRKKKKKKKNLNCLDWKCLAIDFQIYRDGLLRQTILLTEKMIVSSEIIRIFSSANYYYSKTVALLGLKVKIILCSGVMQ